MVYDRFFWLALYAQPALWVGLAVFAIVKFEFIWLSLVGECAICLQLPSAKTTSPIKSFTINADVFA